MNTTRTSARTKPTRSSASTRAVPMPTSACPGVWANSHTQTTPLTPHSSGTAQLETAENESPPSVSGPSSITMTATSP